MAPPYIAPFPASIVQNLGAGLGWAGPTRLNRNSCVVINEWENLGVGSLSLSPCANVYYGFSPLNNPLLYYHWGISQEIVLQDKAPLPSE
eukprot:gene11024-7660_t